MTTVRNERDDVKWAVCASGILCRFMRLVQPGAICKFYNFIPTRKIKRLGVVSTYTKWREMEIERTGKTGRWSELAVWSDFTDLKTSVHNVGINFNDSVVQTSQLVTLSSIDFMLVLFVREIGACVAFLWSSETSEEMLRWKEGKSEVKSIGPIEVSPKQGHVCRTNFIGSRRPGNDLSVPSKVVLVR